MKNETQHTPEPWVFIQEEMKIKGTGDIEGRTVIANVSASMDYSRGKTTQCSNAARIVACVNALEGIKDPADFMGRMKAENVGWLDAYELKQQRDELLEALRICHASLETYGSHPIINKRVANAIGKVTK